MNKYKKEYDELVEKRNQIEEESNLKKQKEIEKNICSS